GDDPTSPAWRIPLKTGGELALYGRIDRIDLYRKPGTAEASCVVVDYKSRRKQLDPVLMAHGIQLQLPAYLNVLRHWPGPRGLFGVDKLIPAGVFYVSLKGSYGRARHRTAALTDAPQARKLAYRHVGRFDMNILKQLDHRLDAVQGDQFNYRLTEGGEV